MPHDSNACIETQQCIRRLRNAYRSKTMHGSVNERLIYVYCKQRQQTANTNTLLSLRSDLHFGKFQRIVITFERLPVDTISIR